MATEEGLAGALRHHRGLAGLTQEELAERAGVSARTVSDIERGRRLVIYGYTAGRLAAALELAGDARDRFERVARGRPPVASGASSPPALATALTPLVGRDREVEEILGNLGSGARVITLTGPGGIGKTRLALEVVARAQMSFADGVHFASLAAVADPDLFPATLGNLLGLSGADEPLLEAVAAHLRGRHTLLVLDTFEHLLTAAPAVAGLLGACPSLSVMVTSRAALHIRGEVEVPVAPLRLPSGGRPPGAARLRDHSAVALFLDRAAAVRANLELDDELATVIVEICRRLEGLPLAIELAAARLRHLPPAALCDQLENRMRLLTGGQRDLPQRQQTMRDTVGWSHDLLAEDQQLLFHRLAVFAGGWTLEAADAVCAPRGPGDEVLTLMSALVDQSLVSLSGRRETEPRYDMLDVIREFAAERLAGRRGADDVRRRHAEFFLALAEEAEPRLGTSAQDVWYRRLDAERENLRGALRWSIQAGEVEVALRLTGALWQFWRRGGDLVEGRRGLEAALSLEGSSSAAARAKALWGAAWLAYHQGDHVRSRVLGEELLPLARRDGGPLDVRNALTVLGMVAMAESRPEEAIPLFEEGLAVCRELGARWHVATSLMNLGVAVLHAGDPSRAGALLEQALALYQELGDRFFSARSTIHLAQSRLVSGDLDGCEVLFTAALVQFRDVGELMGIAEAFEGLSASSAARRERDRAARLAGAAAAVRESGASRQHAFDRALTERYLRAVRDSSWQAAFDEGRGMSVDAAAEYSRRERRLQ